MKKIILPFLLCLITTSVFADIITLRTNETQRYSKWSESTVVFEIHQTITFYNDEFVNIETNKSQYYSGMKSFSGRYTFIRSENVYDDIKGRGVMFYLKKGNIVYAMAIYEDYIIMTGSDDNDSYIYTFYF